MSDGSRFGVLGSALARDRCGCVTSAKLLLQLFPDPERLTRGYLFRLPLLVVDNYRVLHGRSAFTGKRRMCGAYIGGDEYRSRLRVLDELAKLRAAEGKADRSVWDSHL